MFVKITTGVDDTLTQVPVIAAITKNRTEKFAFAIGMLGAIAVATMIAFFFSSIIVNFPYYRYITAGLIYLLAISIYFDWFVHEPRKQITQELFKYKKVSIKRFSKLMVIGFVAAFTTVLDDTIAYLPVLISDYYIWGMLGILVATLLQLTFIVFFSEKISNIKYKEEITAGALVILATLILFNIL